MGSAKIGTMHACTLKHWAVVRAGLSRQRAEGGLHSAFEESAGAAVACEYAWVCAQAMHVVVCSGNAQRVTCAACTPPSCKRIQGLGFRLLGLHATFNLMHAHAAGVDAGVFLVRNSAWTRALFDRLADVARSLPLPTSVVRTPAAPCWTPQHPAL